MSILVKNLSKTYGKQRALNQVNFSLGKGEVLGLLGPNGAGKSTLMKCIVAAIKPTQGSVEINHISVEQEPLKTKSFIGYLPENNPLYMDMYVREYLQFVTHLRQIKSSFMEEAISQVGLVKEQNKKIKNLSKGYKQRVGLAQAIISKPQILILDEPTNGLDPNQILEIRELIKNIGKDKTVIVSTHIMQEVEALCDRVLLLNNGEKITDSSMHSFKENYVSIEEAFHQLTQ